MDWCGFKIALDTQTHIHSDSHRQSQAHTWRLSFYKISFQVFRFIVHIITPIRRICCLDQSCEERFSGPFQYDTKL